MREWDLVVCGAGQAGCALAAKVASGGGRVLILERSASPGEGRDWVVDVASGTFLAAGVPEPDAGELFEEPDATYLVTTERDRMVELHPSPLVPVRNAAYVKRLADWAVERGAVLQTERTVIGPLIEGGSVGGVVLSAGGREEVVTASITADCTGISGAVRRMTPAAWHMSDALDPSEIVLARRETRLIDRDAARGEVRTGHMMDRARLDRIGTQGPYSIETCFLDIERGFADILIGVKPGSGPDADDRFEAFLAERPWIGERVFGDGGPIPIRRPLDTFVADGLVVLGDSACQVIPAHGSGTASALIAADLCAESVLRALDTDRADRSVLWGYNHGFMLARGAVLAYYDVMRRHTDTIDVADLNTMLRTGVLGPDEVFSGLFPEVPRLGPREIASKLPGMMKLLRLMPGVIRSGHLAGRLMRHFVDYPPLYRPGRLEDWIRAMPAGLEGPSAG